MRSGLATSPTISGSLCRLQRRRRRRAVHQRDVRGLDAAIGEIDRGRRLRGAADADEHDIGLVDRLEMLAVVMRKREVQRLDAAEIFGVEHMLRADAAGRARAEIGLQARQHRFEDGDAGNAELAAAAFHERQRGRYRPAYRARSPAIARSRPAPARPAPGCAPASGCARSHACACTARPPRGRRRSASRRSRRRRGADGNSAVSARLLSCGGNRRLPLLPGSPANAIPLPAKASTNAVRGRSFDVALDKRDRR